MIFHGYPRLTGDIDIFFEQNARNAQRLWSALLEFWQGTVPFLAGCEDLLEPGVLIQFGRPPHRIDLLSQVKGITFRGAWKGRVETSIRGTRPPIPLILLGREALLASKAAAARLKDLADIQYLTADDPESKG